LYTHAPLLFRLAFLPSAIWFQFREHAKHVQIATLCLMAYEASASQFEHVGKGECVTPSPRISAIGLPSLLCLRASYTRRGDRQKCRTAAHVARRKVPVFLLPNRLEVQAKGSNDLSRISRLTRRPIVPSVTGAHRRRQIGRGEPPMPSFTVNADWYETFWYSKGPHHKRGAFLRCLARLGATIMLTASSEVVPDCFHG
jgi:hypothetical protein